MGVSFVGSVSVVIRINFSTNIVSSISFSVSVSIIIHIFSIRIIINVSNSMSDVISVSIRMFINNNDSLALVLSLELLISQATKLLLSLVLWWN